MTKSLEVTGMLKISRTFPKLAMSILLLLSAVILISMGISSRLSTAAIKKETETANNVFLNKLDKLYEKELNHIDTIITRFCIDNLNDGRLGVRLADEYQRYLLCDKFADLLASNRFIQSIYIYLNNGQNVYHQSATLIEWEPANNSDDVVYYREFINSNNMSIVTGQRMVSNSDLPKTNQRVISCIKRLPTNYMNTNDAIIFNIKSDYLAELAGSSYIPRESSVLLLDAQGNVVINYSQQTSASMDYSEKDMAELKALAQGAGATFTATFDINNEQFYVIGLKSANGRTGIMMVKEELILMPVSILNRILLIVAICLFLLGVIFSTLIDRRFFQPVQRILKLVGAEATGTEADVLDNNGIKNEFIRIEGYIGQIKEKSRKQELQLRSYFDKYRQKVLQSLIDNVDEAKEALEDDRLQFRESGDHFCIILVSPFTTTPYLVGQSRPNQAGVKLIADALKHLGKVDKINKSEQRLTMLVSSDTIVSAEHIKTTIEAYLQHEINDCLVAIGSVSDCLSTLHKSYAAAKKTLQFLYDNKLAGVFTGADVERLLREQYKSEDYNARHPIMAEIRNYGGENNDLINRVMRYIDDHYQEDISLNIIADYVYFSPCYLGKLFKDIAGCSFTDYLIKIRMEAAAKLLAGSGMKLTEVVMRVGYCSVQGFGRVFKSYYGCSPSEYRKKTGVNTLQHDNKSVKADSR